MWQEQINAKLVKVPLAQLKDNQVKICNHLKCALLGLHNTLNLGLENVAGLKNMRDLCYNIVDIRRGCSNVAYTDISYHS